MNTSNNTSILSKFIAKGIEMIYMRYNEIPQEEINIVSEFIEKLERNKVGLNHIYIIALQRHWLKRVKI